MGRRTNDGNMTGLKQDKFRNSRFEYEIDSDDFHFGGVSRKTPNTLGGITAENRGRRSADSLRSQWDGSPYEDGRLYNWQNRQGWDEFYQAHDRGARAYGDNQLNHDIGNFTGKGPKGYIRSDKSIYEDVCDILTWNTDIDASEIEVKVDKGVVFLSGKVSDRRIKKLAERQVERVSGIKDIQNELTFGREKQDKDLH